MDVGLHVGVFGEARGRAVEGVEGSGVARELLVGDAHADVLVPAVVVVAGEGGALAVTFAQVGHETSKAVARG